MIGTMRFVIAVVVALSLGLLPVGTARATSDATPSPAPTSCHEMASAAHNMDGRQPVSRDMQDCATHCLSQVNGQPAFARLSTPPLVNAVLAQLVGRADSGNPILRDPPDPPPPRSYA